MNLMIYQLMNLSIIKIILLNVINAKIIKIYMIIIFIYVHVEKIYVNYV